MSDNSTTTNSISVTVETAESLGLLPEEFEKIQRILGRIPNFNELSIFSVMWSEHCSYKNSIRWLKTLPREGKRLLVEAGEENAGLVDIGDGVACAFKIESHNHPSAIEPYQGAATGVGGIHRDIFTMGARPIAALNSLRFGELNNNKTRHLLKGVVKGIGDYGNCFGVPTVGGEIYFESCYQTNPLVNAMSVGILEGETCSAIAKGAGNPIFIVGSRTGKDGIHGATFASGDITEDSVKDLPAVQVGDPFQEKLLLEASLEVIATGALVGMQDMGAAGITCSTSEMAAKGECGMKINLDEVPTRQKNMKPWEILLSESQERMLVCVKKGREAEVTAVFDKWDLTCALIGEVTDTGRLEYYMDGQLVADVPAEPLVLGGGAPVYDRETKEPEYIADIKKFDPHAIPVPSDLQKAAKQIASHPNIASKNWVYKQYDSMVGINNTSTNASSDASIIRLKNSNRALAVTTDCNSRYVHADPWTGAAIAVAEASRNIVCSGGEGVAITNCLNFGNPYNPEVYWQFVHAIRGMGDACRRFGTPVTGGNVSFYNQSNDDGPVFPTPVIGMLGIIDDLKHKMTLGFKNEGDYIYQIGNLSDDIASSIYLNIYHRVELSPAPAFDLEEEVRMQQLVRSLIRKGVVQSAHDVSEGGLFISLLESSLNGNLGFEIDCPNDLRRDAILFGEAQGRVMLTISEKDHAKFLELISKTDVPVHQFGKVSKERLNVDGLDFGDIADWKTMYEETIGNLIEQK
ncbi:MAG: phosphoribosylformylglycinamidine synthase II [Limisphaerales bacterium]|jgi:phosphoribosylformylglycinamidine synthase II